jgi:hypothetical protein
VIEPWNDGQLQPSRVLIFESSPLLDSECTLLKERGEFARRAWREWRSSSSVTDFQSEPGSCSAAMKSGQVGMTVRALPPQQLLY